MIKKLIGYTLLPFLFIFFTLQEINTRFPFFSYYTKRAITAGIYLYTIYLSFILFLLPAIRLYIDLYGGWSTIGMIIALNIASFSASIAFFLTNKPKRPQATPTQGLTS